MKASAHSIHPGVAKAITTLNKALADAYPSKDFSLTVSVEGQIVATLGGKEDIVPDVWTDVEAETAKRVVKQVEESAEAAPAPGE